MDECERSHAEIVERIAGAHGIRPETITPLRSMHTGETVGEVATLSAMNIDRAVGAELRIDDGESPVWIRSFHVFSGSFTLIPHFAIEWFGTGDEPTDRVTVLVDLLPRIDLAVNLGYVDEVYGPLQGAYDDVAEVPGFVLERIPPRRAVAMSPWRLCGSVPLGDLGPLVPVIDRYVDRWLSLSSGGVGASVDPLASDSSRLVQHDRFHRNALFDAESDPIWQRIDRFIGPNEGAELRLTLRTQRER